MNFLLRHCDGFLRMQLAGVLNNNYPTAEQEQISTDCAESKY